MEPSVNPVTKKKKKMIENNYFNLLLWFDSVLYIYNYNIVSFIIINYNKLHIYQFTIKVKSLEELKTESDFLLLVVVVLEKAKQSSSLVVPEGTIARRANVNILIFFFLIYSKHIPVQTKFLSTILNVIFPISHNMFYRFKRECVISA